MLNINKKMSNISFLNKDCISIKENELYIVIDSLYLMEIKNNISNLEQLDNIDLLSKIRKEIFPYTDLPFAEYHSNTSLFNIEKIKKIRYDDALKTHKKAFSTDTGLIVFLRINIFKEFILNFDYEILVDDPIEIINLEYWNNVTSNFNNTDVGLIYSIEEKNNIEFTGGGVYIIW